MTSLNDLKNRVDFKIPDGYFDRMQKEVLQKIHLREKRIKQRKIFFTIGSVAASLLIIFNIVFFFPNEDTTELASYTSEKKFVEKVVEIAVPEPELEKVPEPIVKTERKSSSIEQEVIEMELENLDYAIIESYEESMYDLVLLDLY